MELFLVWKTSTGNVERRFLRFSDLHCPESARLLDVSVEECALVDQAPPPASCCARGWTSRGGTILASRMARALTPAVGTGKCFGYISASTERPDPGGPRGATRESQRSLGQDVGQRQPSAASEQLPSTPWWPLPRASALALSWRPPPISLRWRGIGDPYDKCQGAARENMACGNGA